MLVIPSHPVLGTTLWRWCRIPFGLECAGLVTRCVPAAGPMNASRGTDHRIRIDVRLHLRQWRRCMFKGKITRLWTWSEISISSFAKT